MRSGEHELFDAYQATGADRAYVAARLRAFTRIGNVFRDIGVSARVAVEGLSRAVRALEAASLSANRSHHDPPESRMNTDDMETVGIEPTEGSRHIEAPQPAPEVIMDARGNYWRRYENSLSMCPVSTDNLPLAEPIVVYRPGAGEGTTRVEHRIVNKKGSAVSLPSAHYAIDYPATAALFDERYPSLAPHHVEWRTVTESEWGREGAGEAAA